MYQVICNGRRAQYPDHDVHPSWNTSLFDKWEDAVEYTHKWLGVYGWGERFMPNIPIDYSGYGDIVVINEVSYIPPELPDGF